MVTILGAGCTGGPDASGTGDPGEAQVSGSVGGRSFSSASASYRIGKPDDPARTIVMYVFDAEVGCDELSSPGWDERIGDDVQSLEMKVIGTDAAKYTVVAGAMLGAGDASVNYTLASTTSTPQETSADMGTVTLTSVGDGDAEGTFDLTFPDGGTLNGSFRAAPCADGHEP